MRLRGTLSLSRVDVWVLFYHKRKEESAKVAPQITCVAPFLPLIFPSVPLQTMSSLHLPGNFSVKVLSP